MLTLLRFVNRNTQNRKNRYITMSTSDASSQNQSVNNSLHYKYDSDDILVKKLVYYNEEKVYHEEIRSENGRYKSYIGFPMSLSDMIMPLVKSGFYCTGTTDNPTKVQCVFCGVTLLEVDKRSIINKLHKKASFMCPFMLNFDVGNQQGINETKKKPAEAIPNQDLDLECVSVGIPYNVVRPTDMDVLLGYDIHRDIEWREETFVDFGHLKKLSFDGLFIELENRVNYIKCVKCRQQMLLKDYADHPNDGMHESKCYYRNLDKKSKINAIDDGKVHAPCFGPTEPIDNQIGNLLAYGQRIRPDSRIRPTLEKKDVGGTVVSNPCNIMLAKTAKELHSDFQSLVDIKKSRPNPRRNRRFSLTDFVLSQKLCTICRKKPIESLFLPCGHFKTCSCCSWLSKFCPFCGKFIGRRFSGTRIFGD